jgi:hypothetical protein
MVGFGSTRGIPYLSRTSGVLRLSRRPAYFADVPFEDIPGSPHPTCQILDCLQVKIRGKLRRSQTPYCKASRQSRIFRQQSHLRTTLLSIKNEHLPEMQAKARIISVRWAKSWHPDGSCLVVVQVYWSRTNAQAISQASKVCTGMHRGGFAPRRRSVSILP